ncbi:MAG TPA: hypothetical protein VGV57_12360 [Thermoleophilaceae bacterium]|nr:hypothetical protein [Thermoleophilaceae bacterium]
MKARACAGEPVEYAMCDAHTDRVLASVTSAFYGPKIWYGDAGGASGTMQMASQLPESGDAASSAYG